MATHELTVYIDDISLSGPSYVELSGTISIGTGISGPVYGCALELAGTMGIGSGMSGPLAGIYVPLSGTMSIGTGLSGLLGLLMNLTGTINIGTSLPETHLLVFLDIENNRSLLFDGGSSAITVGETVTGATSGATGTVISITITSGTWGGGDAAGTIILGDVVGEFIDNEDLDGSVAGDEAAAADGTESTVGPKIIGISVSKGIDDLYWRATLVCRGIYTNTQVGNWKDIEVLMKDHTDTDQQVFLGVSPDFGVQHNPASKQTIINAVGHMWYIANQQLPDGYLSNTVWIPYGATGYITALEPSVIFTALLGGSIWNSTCGINPSHIIPVSDWGASTCPLKYWGWDKSIRKTDSLMEICEYVNYIFEEYFPGTTTVPEMVMCPLDELETYLTPAVVTFADTTYIQSITTKYTGTQKPNQVIVTGPRNYRKVRVSGVVGTFVETETVTDGGTGAEASIAGGDGDPYDGIAISITGSTEDYIILSYDRTGSFVDGNTIVGTTASATIKGNDEPYVLKDYYSYAYPETEPYRVHHYHERTGEECDSTDLIQARALALYTFLNLDSNEYTVIFNKRTDLRLWQKVKITGQTEIPEEWMRIVWIQYDHIGPNRTVTCTLKNAAYVESMYKLKMTAKYSNEAIVQRMIQKYLDIHLKVEDADVTDTSGQWYTVELPNGELVTKCKGTE